MASSCTFGLRWRSLRLIDRIASRQPTCFPFMRSLISRLSARFSCAPGIYSDVARSKQIRDGLTDRIVRRVGEQDAHLSESEDSPN